jgi:uncharacterized protein YkwD
MGTHRLSILPHRSATKNLLRAIAIASVVYASTVSASALSVVNEARLRDCPNSLNKAQSLKPNAKLNDAAKRIKQGMNYRDALARAQYRADQSSLTHFQGSMDDATLRRMLLKGHCGPLTDAGLTEVGIYASSQDVVILLAAPFAPPAPGDDRRVQQQVLAAVNVARSKGRRCGTKKYGPASPLALNDQLLKAASGHARELAKRDLISHQSADGSSEADRATRAGYEWKFVGENVAAGQNSAAEVVASWLDSPGHCGNIMDADFTQMAVAYVVDPKQKLGIYWVQMFGRPK